MYVYKYTYTHTGLPWWLRWQRIHLQCRRPRLNPWVRKIHWRREGNPIQYSCLKKFHWQRSLAGNISSVQYNSVTQSCLTPCNPTDCSMPGSPIHNQLPETTQAHIHQVGDAIQPYHPLSLLLLPSIFSSIRSFPMSWFFASGAKVLEFQLQHQSFKWIFRTDFLQDGLVGSPRSPRDSQESSPAPQFKSINSSVLSFLYSQTLTSIHDYWINHSLD